MTDTAPACQDVLGLPLSLGAAGSPSSCSRWAPCEHGVRLLHSVPSVIISAVGNSEKEGPS